MISRVYMTPERFEEEQKKGAMKYETYEEYVASVNKLYDELDACTEEEE